LRNVSAEDIFGLQRSLSRKRKTFDIFCKELVASMKNLSLFPNKLIEFSYNRSNYLTLQPFSGILFRTHASLPGQKTPGHPLFPALKFLHFSACSQNERSIGPLPIESGYLRLNRQGTIQTE
jgi:hypothetical protein